MKCNILGSTGIGGEKQFSKKDSPILIEGYWIWWCKTHKQPLAWCNKENAVKELQKKQLQELRELRIRERAEMRRLLRKLRSQGEYKGFKPSSPDLIELAICEQEGKIKLLDEMIKQKVIDFD